MSDVLHFEQLWEEAESLSLKTSTQNVNDIVAELLDLIEKYKKFHTIDSLPETVITGMKNRIMGELLFKLAELSGLENINVYTCLLEEINIAK